MGKNLFYPAIFRLAVSLTLIIDIIGSIFYSIDLYNLPGIIYTWDHYFNWLLILRDNINYFLYSYLLILILWFFGIGKYWVTILVFIFYSIDFFLLSPGVFWGDTILRFTLLYFIFVNSFSYFSIKKDKSEPSIINQLAIWCLMIHFCIIYLDNAIFKLNNEEWLSGYALAYFFKFSKPLDIFNIGKLIMAHPIIIKPITWFILFFQLSLPLIIWIKKIKIYWILIGIIVHLFMALTLQVYKFELIMVLLYGFFITDLEWQSILKKLNLNYFNKISNKEI